MTLNQAADSPQTPSFLPMVSAIVPIYNGEADLPGLIECLKAQTYPASKVEYLLVDNNSSDRTPSILQAAQKEAESQGLTIRHLTENKIQSSYAARNKGIRASTGEILAFTDADCRPLPQWISQLVQPFADPAVGLVVGEITALPGETLLEKYAERQSILTQKDTLAHPFCPYGQTANLGIRRQVFEEIGLFRPYMTTGGDADMCWRIGRETSWKLYFAEMALVQHRHRATIAELKSQWRRYGRSNRYLHELYGVELMRDFTWKESVYRLSRWLVKELPVAGAAAIAGKAPWVDAIASPINLYCAINRSAGQREAKLPEPARTIEWLQ
ncbi:glycosyltransferase [Microseira wollei]|uniref:Glycosyl transferase, family 2 n=1 Tax=Microseira wollei NIES-4236 TaxID=2530354 RepID=A0AAV3X727_9CYAN|nr:glycosyltransferase [Microseira wollei]GET37066.1 glycosyl transferase, family 2 [Microseira wollei NIES-4236]